MYMSNKGKNTGRINIPHANKEPESNKLNFEGDKHK